MADAAQPGHQVRIREPLAAGEVVDYWAIAKTSMTAVVGVRPSGSVIPDYYRVSLDSPGTSTKFAVGSFLIGQSELALSDRGAVLAYRKSEPVGGGLQTIMRLRMMSTQTNNYDWLVSRPDATAGVRQYAFVSLP